jgi:membrane protein
MRPHNRQSESVTASLWKFGGLGWREMLRRLWRHFWKDNVLDQAAMLSFYFILSLFPLLLFLLALLGLMLQPGHTLYQAIHHYVTKVAPAPVASLISSTLQQIRRGSSTGTMSLSLVFSLYMASSGVVAVMDALNVAYGVKESRPWFKQRLLALALTVGSALFMALGLILMGYGDHLAGLLAGHFVTRGGIVVLIWQVLKWLLVVGFLLMAFNLLYIFAPNVKHRRWHWLMPGTVLGALVWILISYGFKLYLTYFNQYNATYGSITAVIILLMWFYFGGIALLLGGELNSEIEKQTHRAERPSGQEVR